MGHPPHPEHPAGRASQVMEVKQLFRAPSRDALQRVSGKRLFGAFWPRMSVGVQDISPAMLPHSRQQLRDVSIDHHYLKTSAPL